jgi:hypothetical protein
MTEYMATIYGPLPSGADPQGPEVQDLVERVMLVAETLDHEPIGGGDGRRGVWSISITVGTETEGEWLDAFEEALRLAVTISVDAGSQVTGIEITSYDDPIFAGIE